MMLVNQLLVNGRKQGEVKETYEHESEGISLEGNEGMMEEDEVVMPREEIIQHLGERVTALRESKGLTQQDIVERSIELRQKYDTDLLSRGFLSQLENGSFTNITLKRFIALLTILDVTPEELGIELNLNRTYRKIGTNVIYVPEGVPVDVVESIRRMLGLLAFGGRVEQETIDRISETRASQAREARGQSTRKN
jgi:transcriptional regulator with XRE-family HTH domain